MSATSSQGVSPGTAQSGRKHRNVCARPAALKYPLRVEIENQIAIALAVKTGYRPLVRIPNDYAKTAI